MILQAWWKQEPQYIWCILQSYSGFGAQTLLPLALPLKRFQLSSLWVQFYHLPTVCNNISESATLHEFHDNPELVVDQITVVHLHNIRVMVVSHYNHLHSQNKIKPLSDKWFTDELIVLL